MRLKRLTDNNINRKIHNLKNIMIMTANRKFFWIFLAGTMGMTAVSCSDKAEYEGIAKAEIDFSAHVENVRTRMKNNDWEGGETIGVRTADAEKAYTVDTDGNMTTADEKPFEWGGTQFELEAWYPYTSEPVSLTDQTTEDKFYGCDLLYSKATAVSKEVTFAFTHKMTRMWWGLQTVSGYTEEEIAAAKVSFYGYASATYNAGTITPTGDPVAEISTYDSMDGFRVGEAMMVPCEMWDKPLIKVEIGGDTYVYTPTRENDTQNRNTGVLAENTRQMYYLQISKEDFTVTMVSNIGEWLPGDMGPVTPDLQ